MARQHKGTEMIGAPMPSTGTDHLRLQDRRLAGGSRTQPVRLERLATDVSVGQISGAMGTYANTDPQVEAISCEILGLTPDTASTG